MATRAERFKAAKERSGPKKPPAPTRKPKRTTTDYSEGAPEPERRIEGSDHTSERNVSKRASKKAVVALEDSATGKPSRKSTRSSKNRGTAAEGPAKKVRSKVISPETKAAKAKAQAKKTR